MNVTIIYGTTKKASFYNSVQLLLNSLNLNVNLNVTEFLLPKDLPSFKRGCFSCLVNGEERRPKLNYVDYIIKSLNESDLIILASPVFICDISATMRSFLEYLSYHYIKNKAHYSMHNKIGLVMSTTKGAGLFHTSKTLKKNLNFWGIHKIFKFTETIYETNCDHMNLKTNIQINEKVFKLSIKILNLYNNSCISKTPIINKMISSKIQPMLKNNNYNVIDFSCWKKHSCSNVRN